MNASNKQKLDPSAKEFCPNENREKNENDLNDNDNDNDDDNNSRVLYEESFGRSSADLEILRAAYPDEITYNNGNGGDGDDDDDDDDVQPDWFPLIFTLNLGCTSQNHQDEGKSKSRFGATITMEFPKGYPTTKSLEVVSYRNLPSTKKDIIEEVVASVKSTAQEAYDVYGGEECGLSCCAAAIECWTLLIEEVEQQTLLEKEKSSLCNTASGKILQQQGSDNNDDGDIHWITSEDTLIDRKSVFQAHLCLVENEDMVKRAVRKLIEGSTKIQRATHNMYAYRFTETLPNGKTILKHDNDDDGEDAAGSRLAQLLEMRKEDGVLILVSRWYGGTHLGPKRFAHITNVARDLLVQCHDNATIK